MNLLKSLAVIAIIFASNAHAALISDYSLNETTNIITDSRHNLEWLQWDETDGLSIDTVLSTTAQNFSGGGWRLATNVEMARLFNTFFGLSYSGINWDTDESTAQFFSSNSDGLTESASDPELIFINLFGFTYEEWSEGILPPDGMQFTSAYYGNDLDNDLRYNLATVIDDRGIGQADSGSTELFFDLYPKNLERKDIGTALVRVTEVEEPSIFILLVLGLVGLGLRRNRFS